MTIVDKNGKAMTSDKLHLAILQADDYRHYRHADPAFKTVAEGLQAYWEDVCQKLLRLKDE